MHPQGSTLGLVCPQTSCPNGTPIHTHLAPPKTRLAALDPQHPRGRDEADPSSGNACTGEDNSRQGEGKKIPSAIFCRFLFNLQTKSGFVREGDGGCSWKFLGFSP